MLAFHNDPAIKEKFISRVKAHQIADDFKQGFYWDGQKGCAVGCTLEMNNENFNIHKEYELQLGIPQILARLEDGIFEGLPTERSKTWPEEFLSSIPVGVDLSKVWPKFAIWLLGDEKYGVIQFAKTEKSKKYIQNIINMYKSETNISVEEWRSAAYAAAAAAAAYAYADAYAAAAAAAYSAAAADAAAADDADAYAAAAADAADAAAAAAAYAAADAAFKNKKHEWRIAQADKLLQLLRETI